MSPLVVIIKGVAFKEVIPTKAFSGLLSSTHKIYASTYQHTFSKSYNGSLSHI